MPLPASARIFGKVKMRSGRLVDAWLPRSCVVCTTRLQTGEEGLCHTCLRRLPGAAAQRCGCCAAVLQAPAAARCDSCTRVSPAFDHTFTLSDYAAPLDRAIVAMKFRQQWSLAVALGDALARHASQRLASGTLPAPDLVVAVPLSTARLLERGFNQAQVLAGRVGRRLRLPAPGGLLRRLWHTDSQSGLSLRERRDNVEGVFDCNPAAGRRLAGHTVLLVDDVMTTGATLEVAADALKCAGATVVINLVLARTPENRVVAGR